MVAGGPRVIGWADKHDEELKDTLQFKTGEHVESCALQGTEIKDVLRTTQATGKSERLRRKRYHFEVVLTGPCFAFNVLIRLPGWCSWHTEQLLLDRSADGVRFENVLPDTYHLIVPLPEKESENANSNIRKSLVELGVTIKVVRFAIWDLEDADTIPPNVLGVTVFGFLRGANPAKERVNTLLANSYALAYQKGNNFLDRAECDALCGLGLANTGRYRQGAEVLLRAAEYIEEALRLHPQITDELLLFQERCLLLAFHALLQCSPDLPEVTSVLLRLTASKTNGGLEKPKLADEFSMDLNTALASVQNVLIDILITAINQVNSAATRIVGAKLLEYVIEHLSYSVGPSLDKIIRCVYTNYRSLSIREHSESRQKNMEDKLKSVLNLCCDSLQGVDPGVLINLFEGTLLELACNEDPDLLLQEEDELAQNAFAELLRLVTMGTNILKGDVQIPPRVMLILFAVSKAPSSGNKVPKHVRQTALVCWNATGRSLEMSARHCKANMFSDHLAVMKDMLVSLFRITENVTRTDLLAVMDKLTGRTGGIELAHGEGEHRRMRVTDKKALARVLELVIACVSALDPCNNLSEAHTVIEFHKSVLKTISNLAWSIMLDIAESEFQVAKHHALMAQAKLGLVEMSDANPVGYVNIEPVLKTLADLFKGLWLVIRLMPRNVRHHAEELDPIREIMQFVEKRILDRSPPKGLLQLLLVIVKGSDHELNENMNKREGISMLRLLRVLIPRLACANHEEIFDLVEVLSRLSARFLMPDDLLDLLNAVAYQAKPEIQTLADRFLKHVASVLVMTAPEKTQEALLAWQRFEVEHGKVVACLSLPVDNDQRPNMESFYLHILLATCFQKFAGFTEQNYAEGSYALALSLEEMIRYASLAVACLNEAAITGRREHKEYISKLFGDIFSRCVMMHSHVDSRVRLAGFQLFCASMNVIFVLSHVADEDEEADRLAFGHISCKRIQHGDLSTEEMGWSFLCNIVTQTLTSPSQADHTVQNVCLEYVKEQCLGLLMGRRSGASVVGIRDLEEIWTALCHLSENTSWKRMYLLSLWIQCVIVNLALFIAPWGHVRARETVRWKVANSFLETRVFPQVRKLLTSTSSVSRFFGIRLAESYLRVRDMNVMSHKTSNMPKDVWNCIDALREDWNDDVATLAGSLRIFSLSRAGESVLGFSHGEDSFEAWIPDLPAYLVEPDEPNVDSSTTKTLDAFLAEHQALLDAEDTELEESKDDFISGPEIGSASSPLSGVPLGDELEIRIVKTGEEDDGPVPGIVIEEIENADGETQEVRHFEPSSPQLIASEIGVESELEDVDNLDGLDDHQVVHHRALSRPSTTPSDWPEDSRSPSS